MVHCYQQAGFLDDKLYCVTHQDGSAILRLWLFWKGLFQLLYRLIRHPGIRAVHLHVSERGSFYRKSLVQALAKSFGKKTILHMHGAEFIPFYEGLPAPLRQWARHTLSSANVVIALSNQWREDLLRICPEAHIQVVYNPCFIQKTAHPKASADGKPVSFLFLGRQGQRKGAYDLVQAASLLPGLLQKNVSFIIRMFGDGDIEQLRQKARSLGIQQHVEIESWLSPDDKEQALAEADAFILPSYHEGLPMAILEALGHGLPVIATPVGGIPEAVEHGINGCLVPSGQPVLLAAQMKTLIEQPELRQKMGLASLAKAKAQFEMNTVLARLTSVYQAL